METASMAIERERVVEIVVSVAAVGLFALVLVGIGLRYNRGGLGPRGGLALIAAIVAFVLLMGGVGYALAYYVTDEES